MALSLDLELVYASGMPVCLVVVLCCAFKRGTPKPESF